MRDYTTSRMISLAFNDVMKGPVFFKKQIAFAPMQARILTKIGDFKPLPYQPELPPRQSQVKTFSWVSQFFCLVSMAGHLMPRSMRSNSKIAVDINDDKILQFIWSHQNVLLVCSNGHSVLLTKVSLYDFMVETARLLTSTALLRIRLRGLTKAYRRTYPEMVSKKFWQDAIADVDSQ